MSDFVLPYHKFELWLESGAQPDQAPLALIKRLEKIRSIKGPNAVLIIVNLLTHEECSLSLFSDSLELIDDLNHASIITLSGCLKSDNYTITKGFKVLVQFLNTKNKQGIL